MKKISKNILELILLIIGIVMIFSPWHLFKICSGVNPNALNPMGYPMKCYYTGKMFVISGGVLALFALIAIIKDKKAMKILLALVAFIISLVNYLIPMGIIKVGDMKSLHWEFGLCRASHMACLNYFKPAMMVILALVLILSIVILVKAFLSKSR